MFLLWPVQYTPSLHVGTNNMHLQKYQFVKNEIAPNDKTNSLLVLLFFYHFLLLSTSELWFLTLFIRSIMLNIWMVGDHLVALIFWFVGSMIRDLFIYVWCFLWFGGVPVICCSVISGDRIYWNIAYLSQIKHFFIHTFSFSKPYWYRNRKCKPIEVCWDVSVRPKWGHLTSVSVRPGHIWHTFSFSV